MSIIQDKPVKITDEELQELKQLQQNKQDLIFALGELEYEKLRLDTQKHLNVYLKNTEITKLI